MGYLGYLCKSGVPFGVPFGVPMGLLFYCSLKCTSLINFLIGRTYTHTCTHTHTHTHTCTHNLLKNFDEDNWCGMSCSLKTLIHEGLSWIEFSIKISQERFVFHTLQQQSFRQLGKLCTVTDIKEVPFFYMKEPGIE